MPTPGPDPSVTDEELLRAISDAYAPAQGTSYVADQVNIDRRVADNHLRRLWDEGLLESEMIGQVRVWWLTDDGRQYIAPDTDD